MKILYVAATSDFISQTYDALLSACPETRHFDDRQDYLLPPFLRGSSLLWRLRRKMPVWRRLSVHQLQRRILQEASGYDVLFSGKGTSILPETLDALRRRNITTVVWFPDNASNEPYATWAREVGPHWDFFFSFDSAIREQVPASNTHVLPFAVDPKYWDSGTISDEDVQRYASDVCFIGAPYPDRVEFLSRVRDVDLRIWGWKGWEKTPLAKYYRGPLNSRESAKAYRLAKVSVNTNVRPMTRGVNLKTFEICAAGGFQLTDAPADLGLSFGVGSELVTFQNGEDFERQVRYWLPRDSERRQIAEAGKARVTRDHTFTRRISEMISTITA